MNDIKKFDCLVNAIQCQNKKILGYKHRKKKLPVFIVVNYAYNILFESYPDGIIKIVEHDLGNDSSELLYIKRSSVPLGNYPSIYIFLSEEAKKEVETIQYKVVKFEYNKIVYDLDELISLMKLRLTSPYWRQYYGKLGHYNSVNDYQKERDKTIYDINVIDKDKNNVALNTYEYYGDRLPLNKPEVNALTQYVFKFIMKDGSIKYYKTNFITASYYDTPLYTASDELLIEHFDIDKFITY